MIPPRLLLAGALVVLALVGAWGYGHARYRAGRAAVQVQWDADKAVAAAAVAEQRARVAALEAQRDQLTRRIEHDLRPQLDAASTAGADLARRLREYQTRARRCPLPGPAEPAAGADGARGEPDDGGGTRAAVDAALAAHLAACGRDAARLTAWQAFYRGLVP